MFLIDFCFYSEIINMLFQDSTNNSDERNVSETNMEDDEENKNTEINRLQQEIERKNNILLQLKAELERQEDYKNLQEQCK